MSEDNQQPVKSKHSYTGYKKSSAHRKAKVIDLVKVKKKLLTVLDRDVNKLLDTSYNCKLSEEESANLRGYLKLVEGLLSKDEASAAEVSEEELSSHFSRK
jgi:hypothetical protein